MSRPVSTATAPITRPSPAACVAAWMRMPRVWVRRSRNRHALSLIRPEQMRDTGLDPVAVAREASKPFWRA